MPTPARQLLRGEQDVKETCDIHLTFARYLKRVHQSMTKLDPLLKTLQVRASPAEGLVQAYLIHIGDRSDANFRKMLELKGIRSKAEQGHLMELFQAHRATHDNLVQASPLLTPLNLNASTNMTSSSLGQGTVSSGPLGLASSSTRFNIDPSSTFGSALMREERADLPAKRPLFPSTTSARG